MGSVSSTDAKYQADAKLRTIDRKLPSGKKSQFEKNDKSRIYKLLLDRETIINKILKSQQKKQNYIPIIEENINNLYTLEKDLRRELSTYISDPQFYNDEIKRGQYIGSANEEIDRRIMKMKTGFGRRRRSSHKKRSSFGRKRTSHRRRRV
jgi:hypothetical protein